MLESEFMSILILFIMQSLCALFAAQIANWTSQSGLVFTILTLIPLFGAFFFMYVICSTALFALDEINALKAQKKISDGANCRCQFLNSRIKKEKYGNFLVKEIGRF